MKLKSPLFQTLKLYNTSLFRYVFLGFVLFGCSALTAQDDLLDLIEEEPETDYTYATFKSTRLINGQTIETVAPGDLDIKIQHRFGVVKNGLEDFFGLDFATIRLGLDYGVTKWLMVGLGRSSFEKTLDGNVKIRLFSQSQGKINNPLTVSWYSEMTLKTSPFANPNRVNHFSSRISYVHQLLLARKFNEYISVQLMPTLVHRNLVNLKVEPHDIYGIGIGARVKLTKRTSVNAEYFHILTNGLPDSHQNALSVGFDIETGGHVFQLYFTNANQIITKGILLDNTNSWSDGNVHFGFTLTRVFTLIRPKIFREGEENW